MHSLILYMLTSLRKYNEKILLKGNCTYFCNMRLYFSFECRDL